MATTIQLLRSDIAQQRPDPGVLANGVPMVNLHESEPGLFFSGRDGNLFKVGPVSVGDFAPNSSPQGELGNSRGEMWLDTSGTSDVLKIYDGSTWVPSFTDPGGTVTSVALTFGALFAVTGSPVTTSGTLSASLLEQDANAVFAGPSTGAASQPSFRPLVQADIPDLSASKIVTGLLDAGRIPGLDAGKITSGTFPDARIPGLNASKITSGVLTHTRGGTGVGSDTVNGDLLIGNGAGWTKATLSATAGGNINISNGSGTISLGVAPTPAFSGVSLKDSTGDLLTLTATSVSIPYTLNLPAADGTAGALLSTNGAGQLSFVTSLTGMGSIAGLGNLTIFAGGANGNITLSPTGSGYISADTSRITDVSSPTAATDAANKAYVDGVAAGIQPKAQVVAASTGSNLALSGIITLDGVLLVAGDRVLVKDQTAPEDNGIYEAAAGAWTRTADANTFADLVGATVFVAGGAINLGDTYLCTAAAGGTLGVDPVPWVVFSSGLGTVTSVDLSLPAEFSLSGNPITTSGTITASYANQSINTVFAGPSTGSAGTPSFRALVAADIPATLGSHTLSSLTVTGAASLEGDVDIGDSAADTLTITAKIDSDLIPTGTQDLGSAADRWDNIYTNDLHMSNEGHVNDVDGTWGSYTIQEGEENLYLINRRSGKRYKFVLEEVS